MICQECTYRDRCIVALRILNTLSPGRCKQGRKIRNLGADLAVIPLG